MREIDRLLSTHRQVQGEVYVDSKNQARSSVCSLAPPKTIVNRFAGLVPPLNLTPVFGDDVRGVFLTHLPAAERPSAAATERLLGSTVRKSKLLRAIQPNNAFMSHSSGGLEPLAGLSSTAVGANRTVAAPATTRSATDTLGLLRAGVVRAVVLVHLSGLTQFSPCLWKRQALWLSDALILSLSMATANSTSVAFDRLCAAGSAQVRQRLCA